MQQTRFFVPARLGLAVMAIVFMAVASPKASTPEASTYVIYVSDTSQQPVVDHIITGQTISSDQQEDWKAKRKKYKKCGLCGSEQPYPGD